MASTPPEEGGKKTYANGAKPLPVLTPEQKLIVAQNWKMDIRELTRLVFNDPLVDGRSIQCKAVKQELAAIGQTPVPVKPAPTLTNLLTDEHKQYIRSSVGSSSALEMARILYGNDNLMLSSAECKLVTAYCREIDPSYKRDEELADGPFTPPPDMKQLVPKVNRYAINPRKDGKAIYDHDNLSNNDRKQLQALMGYMKQITLYRTEGNKEPRKDDRELYESTFIAMCWDKPDLMQEEVMQYIAYAAETVKYTKIERLLSVLDERLRSTLESPGGKVNMAEVELLNSVREKSNASMKQSATLLKALVGDRAKRLSDKIQASASMHNLVEAWRQQDNRRKIIQMSERKQKMALKAEVERLSDLDALKCELFGLVKDDILN